MEIQVLRESDFVCHVEAQKAQDACPELAQRVQTQSKISVEK